jgi:predicted ATPase/class 3 adenylate cyclase/Tfp pilus assembly protein PilF
MNPKPTGTITFLFTDIEGSTRRWDAFPEAMREALARHDHLLRTAITNANGYVFKTVGDAFCAAFQSPESAVDAVWAAQKAIAATSWDAVDGIRVRMALHTGTAQERDGDYFGPVLNRVARLLSLAYGGQVLLSSGTTALLQGKLPPRLELQDRGRHRLKDLAHPEHVYQLCLPDLLNTFPPLKSLDARPNNLPAQPTSFVGREQDIEALSALIRRDGVRLITITGPGGIGKTRLSLQAAANVSDEFPDGLFFVPLAAVESPTLVLPEIAQTLGVPERPGHPLVKTLYRYLEDKHLLLILDNLEQVVDIAPTLTELLQVAPRVKILTSSRIVLQLYGEYEYPLSPLNLPEHSVVQEVQTLLSFETIRLFSERAQAVRPAFTLTEANAAAVVEICRQLDGLPLAIELAAARIKLFTPQALLDRLASALNMSGGARNLPTRQQTLRGAIEWSYNLLSPADQRLFAILSIFAGSFTAEAVASICDRIGESTIDPWEGILSLVNQSLIRQQETDAEPRFTMLLTIRAFASDCLKASGITEQLHEVHTAYYLSLVEGSGKLWQTSQQHHGLNLIEADYDNIRSALRWSVEQGRFDLGLRLTHPLPPFWEIRGHMSDGRKWLGEVMSLRVADVEGYRLQNEAAPHDLLVLEAHAHQHAGRLAEYQGDYAAAQAAYEQGHALALDLEDESILAQAMQSLASLAYRQGDYELARHRYEEARRRWQALNHTSGVATVLQALGNIANRQGDLSTAEHFYRESLHLRRLLKDQRAIATTLNNLGILALRRGELSEADRLWAESLALKQQLGDRSSVASVLNNLGTVARRRGDWKAAKQYLEQGLALKQELGDRPGITYAYNGLGNLYMDTGDLPRAFEMLVNAVQLAWVLGDKWAIAVSLEDIARYYAIHEEAERAIRFLGAGTRLRETIGAFLTEQEQQWQNEWRCPLWDAYPQTRDVWFSTGYTAPLSALIESLA